MAQDEQVAVEDTAPKETEATQPAADADIPKDDTEKPKKTGKAEAKIAQLTKELETAKAETEEAKQKLLRTLAEYDNYRKRTEKEKTAIYDNAVKDTVGEILDVADTMEMALAHRDIGEENLRRGVEMIQKNLLDTLQKLKVEPIGEEGEVFDPELHQAVSHVEDPTLGENIIQRVYRKGYRIGDLVIRHASVVVAN